MAQLGTLRQWAAEVRFGSVSDLSHWLGPVEWLLSEFPPFAWGRASPPLGTDWVLCLRSRKRKIGYFSWPIHSRSELLRNRVTFAPGIKGFTMFHQTPGLHTARDLK